MNKNKNKNKKEKESNRRLRYLSIRQSVSLLSVLATIKIQSIGGQMNQAKEKQEQFYKKHHKSSCQSMKNVHAEDC